MLADADNAMLHAQGWKRYPTEQGFEHHIGPLWYRKRDDEVVVFGFRAGLQHLNPMGIVHGGMLVTFADHVLGSLVWHRLGRKPCATASLNSDFLSSAKLNDWIEGVAEITRLGRSVVFVRGQILVENKTILTVSGIWKVIGAT